jgi:hypothetical protein
LDTLMKPLDEPVDLVLEGHGGVAVALGELLKGDAFDFRLRQKLTLG